MPRKKKTEIEKVLTEVEMRSLEQKHTELIRSRYELKLMQNDVQIHKLKIALANKELTEKVAEAESARAVMEGKQNAYAEESNSIRLRKKLGSSWGYDPISGEIKE